MSPDFLTALIGGAAGIVSAIATAFITNFGVTAASKRSEDRQAQYLAVQVGTKLREFGETCLRISYDDGTLEGRPAGEGGIHIPTVRGEVFNPEPVDGLNWLTLPAPLMVEVLTFEEKHKATRDYLGEIHDFDDGPDYPEFFCQRRLQYAALGLEAVELGIRLFRETEHTSELFGASSAREELMARKSKLEQELADYEDRRTAAWQVNADGMTLLAGSQPGVS